MTFYRALDWFLGLYILHLGVTLLQAGNQIPYAILMERMPEAGWMAICLGLGIIRVAALIINGYWRKGWSAAMRAGAAILAAVFWSQVLTLNLLSVQAAGWWTISAAGTLTVLLGELVCAARGGVDFMRGQQRAARAQQGAAPMDVSTPPPDSHIVPAE